MALQDAIRWILPKEDTFYDLLEKQAVAAAQAAVALAKLGASDADPVAIRRDVQDREHDGDRLVHEVEEALARTFVTPIDREDIQKLSTDLDDILDLTNHVARSFVLYGALYASPAMVALLSHLVECTAVVAATMPALRRGAYADLREGSRSVKAIEKKADEVFRDAVSALFSDESVDAKALVRDKELLELLEQAIDACEDAAEFLMHLAVKNG